MTPQILLPDASPEAWLEQLQQQARQLGHPWLDLIVDQAEMSSRWQKRQEALHPPRPLLLATPHADAAEEGPVLLRVSAEHALPRLLRLLQQHWCQPRFLALLSHWDFNTLAERLTLCLQAAWDQNRQKGVLRYHDPRLFAAVAATLDAQRRQLLLEPASQWHWLDRDGHARMLDATPLQTLPALAWAEECLTLEPAHVDELACWHLAESWRQNYLLTPQQYGLESEEELLRRLAKAHQAADQAGIWSEDERMTLLDGLLRQGAA